MSSGHAHARYMDSTPAKGAVLVASPAQVSITFTQEVQKVTGTYGIEVKYASVNTAITIEEPTNGPTSVKDSDRTMISVPLKPNLPPGRYEVRWKNVSDADGDAAEGAFSFYVAVQPTPEDLAADAELALIGEDEQTPQATEPATSPEPGRTPPASATATAPNGDDDEGGGSTTWIILGAVIAVGIVAGFLAARVLMSRRA